MVRLGAIFLFFLISVNLLAQEEGTASYYSQKFQGRKTASGEKFETEQFTAAHKSLPFGTIVQVTDKVSGKTVTVKINDRLPENSKRVIDLSPAAARELEMIQKGLTRVKIEIQTD